MGDLEHCEQSIKELLLTANNTTSDSITSTTTTTSLPQSKHSSASKNMGGVVSRLNAAIFGARPPRGIISQLLKHQNNRNKHNGLAKDSNLASCNADYQDVEANLGTDHRQLYTTDYSVIDIPSDVEDEVEAGKLGQSTFIPRKHPEIRTAASENSCNRNEATMQSCDNTQEGVVTVNEHFREDEEEAEDSGSEITGLEKVESDQEEEEDDQAEADEYDSDEDIERLDEDSDFEVEMGHICDSDCEHSDIEESDTQNLESDSEGEAISETDGEVVEFTDDEEELEEEDEVVESEDEEFACDCHSECPSDCDGDHHECSSQCGCDVQYSDSDDDTNQPNANAATEQTYREENRPLEEDDLSPLRETAPPIDILNASLSNGIHKRQASLPESSFLLLQANAVKQSQRGQRTERNNNNNNKLVASQSMDLVNELQSAIDARVKRSASCRAVTTHRKLSNPHLDSGETKVEHAEREAWRKDRRARLRTLELKREQILDEVRDGTKDRVTDTMYSEVSV